MLEVRRGVSVLAQAEHPGIAIADPLHAAIRWRLLFPAIGHVLQLPAAVLFGLAPLGCLVTLAFIVAVLRRRGLGFPEAGLAALILGATSWFFTSVSWLGYYDSWLVLALLVTAFAEASWPVWLACLLAPWVDERFVLAAPLALLCRHVWLSGQAAAGSPVPPWRRELTVAAGLLGAFVVVRLGLLSGPAGAGTSIPGYFASFNFSSVPWTRVLFGAWSGLRVAWFFVAAAAWCCWRQRAGGIWMAVAVAALLVAGLGTAQDLSRAMMLELPAALLGVLLAAAAGGRWLPWALRTGAAAALLLPAHHVMSDRVNPIYYLYHELDVLDNPPAVAMPELRVLRGILEEEQGDAASAEQDFTLAVKLGGNTGLALQHRGVLYANQRRWAEARRDFSGMVEQQPGEPDGWFLRAQADLALGDSAGARADLQQALAVGSPPWLHRPDVARFAQRLNVPVGQP